LPIGGDDAANKVIVTTLQADFGFDTVDVGPATLLINFPQLGDCLTKAISWHDLNKIDQSLHLIAPASITD